MSFLRRLFSGPANTVRFGDALRDGNPEMLTAALSGLATASPRASVEQLNQLAELHPDTLKAAWLPLRKVSVPALRPLFLAVGSKTKLAPLPPQAAAFDGLQPPVRGALARTLGKVAVWLDDANANAYKALIADSDPAVRREAVSAINHRYIEITLEDHRCNDSQWVEEVIKPEAQKRIPLTLSALRDRDPWVRAFAVEGYGQTQALMPIDDILPLIDDPAPHVKATVITALASSKAAGAALERLAARVHEYSQDLDNGVRSSVCHFYSMKTFAAPDLVRRYRSDLEALSRDGDADIRKGAREALTRL